MAIPPTQPSWVLVHWPEAPLYKAVLLWWTGERYDLNSTRYFYTPERAREELKELRK